MLITRICTHTGVSRHEDDEIEKPKGHIGLTLINRSRSQKRSRLETAEESSSEEKDEGEEPAFDPTADITTAPSEADPSQTYEGGVAPSIEGVM